MSSPWNLWSELVGVVEPVMGAPLPLLQHKLDCHEAVAVPGTWRVFVVECADPHHRYVGPLDHAIATVWVKSGQGIWLQDERAWPRWEDVMTHLNLILPIVLIFTLSEILGNIGLK